MPRVRRRGAPLPPCDGYRVGLDAGCRRRASGWVERSNRCAWMSLREYASGVTIGSERVDRARSRLTGDQLGDDLAADRRERNSQHRMAARGGQIGEALEAAEVRQAIRRARPKPRADD